MPYKITVEWIDEKMTICKGNWVPVSTKEGETEYGYAPDVERMVKTELKIYEQTVADLEISELVRVVNDAALIGRVSP